VLRTLVDNSSQQTKLELWDVQSKLTKPLLNNPLGTIASIHDAWRVFNTPDKRAINAIGCGDEGMIFGCRSHAPAAGMLRDQRNLVKQLLSAGITGIVTHDNCAAERIARQRGITLDWWLDSIQTLSDGKIQRIQHIQASDMARPADKHIAPMILVRAMRRVSFTQSQSLPLAFNIDAKTCPEFLPEDLLLYLNIAMGPSGFGGLFTSTNPLVIMVIGRNPFSRKTGLRYQDLRRTIERLLLADTRFAMYRKDYRIGRIVITGFDPPASLVDPDMDTAN